MKMVYKFGGARRRRRCEGQSTAWCVLKGKIGLFPVINDTVCAVTLSDLFLSCTHSDR